LNEVNLYSVLDEYLETDNACVDTEILFEMECNSLDESKISGIMERLYYDYYKNNRDETITLLNERVPGGAHKKYEEGIKHLKDYIDSLSKERKE
jgi:hypothetical protein